MRTLLGTTWGLVIDPSSIGELEAAPNIHAILDAYSAESAIAGLPPPSAKVEVYKSIEAAGLLSVFTARVDGELVGYITVLVNALPHYGIKVAMSESFFVLKEHRRTGAGLKLLKAAEAKAIEKGAPGLLVSAPFEGDLFKVLPRVGYRESNRVFFKSFMALPARIESMGAGAIAKVERLAEAARQLPHHPIETTHTLHGGLYSRTVLVPAGVAITGVRIVIPTTVIVSGDCEVFVDGEPQRITGYRVIAASANRKQAFHAFQDTWITMTFPTDAKTVEEAERQFTDEPELLASRRGDPSLTLITGE